MCGITYLTLAEVAEKLKISTKDAAARWCLDHGIKIFSLLNKNVVIEYEFRKAFEEPIIEHLKHLYKDKWLDYYKAYDSEDITNYFLLEINTESDKSTIVHFNPNKFLKEIGYEGAQDS